MRLTAVGFAAAFLATALLGQPPADTEAIRDAALDYIEGWYTADAARMERAIHPELAKRWIRVDDNGESRLQSVGSRELIEQTRGGGGNKTPIELRRKDVEILDVDGEMATVKVTSARYVDYMHLARWDNSWKIVNVLWQFRPKQDQRPAAAQGPAARRLQELIAAIGSGDPEQIRAYVREAYAPARREQNPEERVVQAYMAMHNRFRGIELESLRTTETEAAALLRSRLTGLQEPFSVQVEAEPPHRIVGPASFSVTPPPHPLSAPSATDAERVAEIARLARTLHEASAFSGTVLIARGDTVLYLGTFGEANQEARIPVRPETRYDLASITKTFITVSIAQLAERGRLSWDDPIGKFIPDFPPAEAREKVRIRHLVTHTSGLQDTLRYCERNPCPSTFRSLDDFVRLAGAAQQGAPLVEPGTQYSYNNANFALLAAILERVSGQHFYEYVRKNIFARAGMSRTDFTSPGSYPPRIAVGYDPRYEPGGARFTGGERERKPANYPAPFCCAHSTAHDLFRYARALSSGKLLRPETVRLLFSPKPEAGSWGYGFDILEEDRGLVAHSGSWTGVSNALDLFTKSGYTSVILSNYTNGRSPLREAIRRILP